MSYEHKQTKHYETYKSIENKHTLDIIKDISSELHQLNKEKRVINKRLENIHMDFNHLKNQLNYLMKKHHLNVYRLTATEITSNGFLQTEKKPMIFQQNY
jgi:hypothetical protein